MAAIDKEVFAKFALRQALFCGVNAHYLVAIAELRSKLDDGSVGPNIGPYRFTQAEWNANRRDPEFEPDFLEDDITRHRAQCSIFARMTYHALDKLVDAAGGRMPSALELYIEQLAARGTPVTDETAKEQLARDLNEAIAATRDAARKAEVATLEDESTPSSPEVTPETILFRRGTGARAAQTRGHLIAQMQDALIRKGHLAATDAGRPNNDGIFGPRSETALKAWQTANGHPATGELTHGQWAALTAVAPPDIFDRCAQVTASFEGTNFGGTNATDFDETVLTFGYIGLTILGGNLQLFLKEVDSQHPGLLNATFGSAKAADLRTLFPPATLEQAKTRGRALFVEPDGKIKEDWRAAFKTFGETPESKAAQLAFTRRTYWRTSEEVRAILGLAEPLSHAVCFDVAVQNGGKKQVARNTSAKFTSEMGEQEKRLLFSANVVRSLASPQFAEDVRSRKGTLSEGRGVVHDGLYLLDDWGFAAAESAEADEPGPMPSGNPTFDTFFRDNLPGVTGFSSAEFLVKGAKHAINGLNKDPPQPLWPNIVKTVKVLVELKRRLGNPRITLNSVYRSREYNASVGGASNSLHMKFNAVDFTANSGSPSDWARILKQMRNEGFFAGGVGTYNSFVHVDTRGHNATW
jgi:peptidoglycan hydrolase-like protein with peptidoglycan-binding domain